MYLSSPRVNIAEESVEDHRVQLQCKFDEKEGKYTEAKPRCTCPSYESNLHQVGEVQHQLPLDLMLVHFRPHLCSGYTDQYHSFLQKVKSSMITEQNGILIHLGTFVFHIIYFYQNSQRPPRTPSVHFLNFYYFKRCNSISVTYNYLVYGVK